MSEDTCIVCYVGDAPKVVIDALFVSVEGRKQDQPYITFEAKVPNTWHDLGENKQIRVEQDVRKVVASYIETEENLQRGFFIPKGRKPTAEEIRAAEMNRNAYRDFLIGDANSTFLKEQNAKKISDEARWAAQWLGYEAAWVGNDQRCVACGKAVSKSGFKCGSCGEVYNLDAYRKHKEQIKAVDDAVNRPVAAAAR